MDADFYQNAAMRTNDGRATNRLYDKLGDFYRKPQDLGFLLNCCLGLSGEVGELNDMVKKWIFHESNIDFEHLEKELGDILWYVSGFASALGWSLSVTMEKNVDKLLHRYPNKFTVEAANNRKEDDV